MGLFTFKQYCLINLEIIIPYKLLIAYKLLMIVYKFGDYNWALFALYFKKT